jgi:hypothetical protein
LAFGVWDLGLGFGLRVQGLWFRVREERLRGLPRGRGRGGARGYG